MNIFEIYIIVLQQSDPTNRVLETFTHGYEDRLQIPLQPLADNLESRTYEIFEKDPIKYVQYENVNEIIADRKSFYCLSLGYLSSFNRT